MWFALRCSVRLDLWAKGHQGALFVNLREKLNFKVNLEMPERLDADKEADMITLDDDWGALTSGYFHM
uniref:Alpha-D-xyloside xylohydrolase n=1 Tax=Ascaris lumbricoides TaxID=6252 RepID=A0A0M3I3B2_ASCLU